jgi:dienelactone hydrolase
MKSFFRYIACLVSTLAVLLHGMAQQAIPFASTPLTGNEDLSVKMVNGINDFLIQETKRRTLQRASRWKRDFSSAAAFDRSISKQRAELKTLLGVTDERIQPVLQIATRNDLAPYTIVEKEYTVSAVRWTVMNNLSAEGILIIPAKKVKARAMIIPDAGIEPEALAGMLKGADTGSASVLALAKSGVEILIPVLINRDYTYSGNPSLDLYTQQPHREWIYRQAYEIGRHIIGYELQKIFSGIDWLEKRNKEDGNNTLAVAGYGEGGMLALYAAALDSRITVSLVSGYFNAREQLWEEPIYRNVFGLLNTFGDAELAVMNWPRRLIIEHTTVSPVNHQNAGAAPGKIISPSLSTAEAEYRRAATIIPSQNGLNFITAGQQFFSAQAFAAFAKAMNVPFLPGKIYHSPAIQRSADWIKIPQRQERQVREMTECTQQELSVCERTRNRNFWQTLKGSPEEQAAIKEQQRERFRNVLGKMPAPSGPFNTKARVYQETAKWISYEITLDVFGPEVFAWGILTVPKDIRQGEKRPVVVCQHGLEGLPFDVVNTDSTQKNYSVYKGFATRLAERGYITFAPHNPYRGQDKFRVIQRKANPIGLTLFSVIISQHQRIVEWLQELSFADAEKIAFYGISYGGKTAMRVPAVVKGYCLSICSADFNEWVRKVATTEHSFGYVYTGEYDMPEWDLGHTFNYAEMAALIAPRPFMVERGYFDGVGADEWVSYEFGKVQRYYDLQGLDTLVAIEHFTGPHSINGKATFEFLDKHLKKQPGTNF